jgi:hypothetical protein
MRVAFAAVAVLLLAGVAFRFRSAASTVAPAPAFTPAGLPRAELPLALSAAPPPAPPPTTTASAPPAASIASVARSPRPAQAAPRPAHPSPPRPAFTPPFQLPGEKN